MAERKKPAVSYLPEDWETLRTELGRRSDPEAHVLLVIAATGLRIGDVLGIEVRALRHAVKHRSTLELVQKGGGKRQLAVTGVYEVWERLSLQITDGSTVAEWICPTSAWGSKGGGGAYQRCNRYLRSLAGELQLEGRPHLHRMRRTVATRAIRKTRDIHLVSQLLGHKQIGTTQGYTDELRSEEVSSLHAELWK